MPKYTDVNQYNYTVPKSVEELFCRCFFLDVCQRFGISTEDDDFTGINISLNGMEIDTDNNTVRLEIVITNENNDNLGTEYYIMSVKKEV